MSKIGSHLSQFNLKNVLLMFIYIFSGFFIDSYVNFANLNKCNVIFFVEQKARNKEENTICLFVIFLKCLTNNLKQTKFWSLLLRLM